MPIMNISPEGLGTPMPGNNQITEAWVETKSGGKITNGGQLNSGDQFRVACKGIAANNGQGFASAWTICITYIDLNDAGIKNYGYADSLFTGPGSFNFGSGVAGPVRLDRMGEWMTMPGHDMSLKMKIFMADGLAGAQPIQYPPVDQWSK